MKYSKSWREPKKLTPETLIKQDVKRYLSLKGWFCFSVLQGLGAHKGIADIIACKEGRTIFIEIKTPRGKQSPDQIVFQKNIEMTGNIYMVVRGLDDLINIGI